MLTVRLPLSHPATCGALNATLDNKALGMARTESVDEPGGQYQRVVDLLGGSKVFSQRVLTPLDAHNAIRKGLPGCVLQSFVTNFRVLKPIDIEKAVGMSVLTYQRRSAAPEKPLSAEQGGRTWKLAEY